MLEILESLSQLPIVAFLRQSDWAYPLTSAIHILSLGLILGAIVTLDLRLLGFFGNLRINGLARPLVRVSATGVLAAILSGVALFSVQPQHYIDNTAFLLKLTLVSLAILNALIIRSLPHWRKALLSDEVHPLLQANALLSIVLWILAVLAGRWIAFI